MHNFTISMHKLISEYATEKLNYYDNNLDEFTECSIVTIGSEYISKYYHRNGDDNKFIHIGSINHCDSVVRCFMDMEPYWDTVTCGLYVRYTPKSNNAYTTYSKKDIFDCKHNEFRDDTVIDCKKDIDTISIYVSDPFRDAIIIHVGNIPYNTNMKVCKYIKEHTA